MTEKLWTVGRILKWTEQYFGTKGVESPRLDAEVLLSHVLNKERIYLYVHFDEPLEAGELASYRELVRQRAGRVPVAYLVGEREFMGISLRVNPSVLIPRPETEILVQAALDRLQERKEPFVADIGTGSGAICLALLHYLVNGRGVGVDLSEDALEVARENAEHLGLSERTQFLPGDLLEPLKEGKFAAILSNPPYIPDGDISKLAPEVRDKEPRMALAGGEDGMKFYRRLCKEAPSLLEPKGFLAMEVGIRQGKAVEKMAKEHPLVERTELLKDLAGIDRVVIAWRGAQ